MSTPEGHDKPVKYPETFAASDVVILNKMALIPMVHFDRGFFYQSLQALNSDAITFEVSYRTGEDVATWSKWLLGQLTAVASLIMKEGLETFDQHDCNMTFT